MAVDTPSLEQLAKELLTLSKMHEKSTNALLPETPIVAKANELIAAAQAPTDHATSKLMHVLEGAVIRTLVYLKAIQSIPTIGSISVSDLAAITGAQAALLERLLRVVVGTGFVFQHGNGEYSHTYLSLEYAGSGAADFLQMCYDEVLLPLTLRPEYLEVKRSALGLVEPGGGDSSAHNPVSWSVGQFSDVLGTAGLRA